MYRPWIIPIIFFKFELYVQIVFAILIYFLIVNYFQDLSIFYSAQFPEDASYRKQYKSLK